jgi:hypothetical protein
VEEIRYYFGFGLFPECEGFKMLLPSFDKRGSEVSCLNIHSKFWSGVLFRHPRMDAQCMSTKYRKQRRPMITKGNCKKPIMISIRLLLRGNQLFETRGTKLSPSALTESLSRSLPHI